MNKNRLLFLVWLILNATWIFAQTDSHKNIEPDKHYFWNKEHKWDNHDEPVRNFYAIGSDMVCATAFYKETVYDDGYIMYEPCLDLHRFNVSKNEFEFVKQIDRRNNVTSIEGTPVCFAYGGKNFIINYYYDTYQKKHFQKCYYTKTSSLETWHSHNPLYSNEVSKLAYYKAAFVEGGYIYLIYDGYYHQFGNDENEDELVYFTRDIKIDVCKINSDYELDVIKTHTLDDVMGKDSYHPYEVNGFVHPDGHIRLLISYSAERTDDKENKGGGVLVYKLHDETIKHLYKDDDFSYAVRATFGSIQGGRSLSDLNKNEKENLYHIQVFYNHFEDHNWGPNDIGHYYYRTYSVDKEEYALLRHGMILHDDDDDLPDQWNNMCLDVTYLLESVLHDDQLPANDAYQEYIYMFRTDKNNCIHADVFTSNSWMPDPQKTVSSIDLADTVKYGPGIRNLWTLIGITEGAPPVSIDWDKWEATHTSDIDPTELTFTTETSNSSKVTYSYDRTFYSKTGVKIGNEETGLSGEVSYKYTNAFANDNSIEIKNTVAQTTNFTLNEESQKQASLLWLIPDIYRVTYAIYPWWDKSCEYPLENSESYLYYSPSGSLVIREVPIADYPFHIVEPNDPEMKDWKCSAPSVRDTIQSNASIYGVVPVSVSWTAPQTGGSARLCTEKITTGSTKQTSSYEMEFGITYTVPKVFQLSETLSLEESYSTEIEHQTSVSKEVEVSLKNLTTTDLGPAISGVTINTYFFEPMKDSRGNEINWWYYKYFPDQKPWYITYVVTDYSGIEVISPSTNNIYKSMPDIAWENKNGGDYTYSVLFSHNPRFHMGEVVELGTYSLKYLKTETAFPGQNLVKDSVIYYVVKGVDQSNNVIWSDIRWFMVSDQYTSEISNVSGNDKLNFIIYPNPVTNGKLKVLFNTLMDDSELSVNIISLEGRTIKAETLSYSKFSGGLADIQVDGLAPGMYYLRIFNKNCNGTEKFLIK